MHWNSECWGTELHLLDDAWDGETGTEEFQSGLGHEFLACFDKFWGSVLGCRDLDFRLNNHCLWSSNREGTPCVPCQLRHVLPQLLSVRVVCGAGRPVLCVDAPVNRKRCCLCSVLRLLRRNKEEYIDDCPKQQESSWYLEAREGQREVWARRREAQRQREAQARRRDVQDRQREVQVRKWTRRQECNAGKPAKLKGTRRCRSQRQHNGQHKSQMTMASTLDFWL